MQVTQPRDPRSALLVVPQRIGDVLLATPIIASLKRKWPTLDVDILVFKGTEGIVAGNTQIRTVHTIEQRARTTDHLALIRRIWRRYDVSISPLCGDRPILYAWAASKFSVGPVLMQEKNQGWKRKLLSRCVEFDDVGTHTVSMGLKVSALLDVDPCAEVQVSWAPEDEATLKRNTRELPLDAPLVVLHPTPKYNYKQWHVQGWREVVDWLCAKGMQIVITGSADSEEAAYLKSIFPKPVPAVFDLAGKLNFGALAALLKRARLYIGPDTVVTHMAAALGVPTVALFGPSNPVKWGPWPSDRRELNSPWAMQGSGRVGNVFLVQGEAHCVPCREEGCERHLRSYSDCLVHLSSRRVIDAADTLLSSGRS
jgi:heptosyltransferase III